MIGAVEGHRKDPAVFTIRPFLPPGATVLAAVVLLAPIHPDAGAAAGPVALGALAGTTGAGAEAGIGLGERASLRISHTVLSGAGSVTWRGLPYEVDASMGWTSVLLDLHPSGGSFRLSGGAAFSSGDMGVAIDTRSPVELGGRVWSPGEVGAVRGTVSMDPVAPYLGIGFDGAGWPGGGLGLSTDFGIVLQSYSVELRHEGGSLPMGMEQELANALEGEEDSVENDLNGVGVYPVIRVSLALRI